MEHLLESVGFTKKQAKVYLTCLELGKDTAFHIAKKADMKRPTVYLILGELVKKGFVSILQTPKVTLYSPAHPKTLLTDLKTKERKLEASLVNLESLYESHSNKPRIQTFEGRISIEKIYDDVTDYARIKGKEVLAFGSTTYLQELHRSSYTYWLKSIGSKRCHIREVLNADETNLHYLSDVQRHENPNHEIRLLSNAKRFMNDNMIYGDKAAFFSSEGDMFVSVIEHANLTASLKTLFELAWKASKPV